MPMEPIRINYSFNDKERFFFIDDNVFNVLQLISEHNFISSSVMKRLFGSRMKFWRKTKPLMNAGFIQSFDTMPDVSKGAFWNASNSRKAYCLTKAGYLLLAVNGLLRVDNKFKPSLYRISSYYHTVACAETRIAIGKDHNVIDYFSESVVSCLNNRNPSIHFDKDSQYRPDAEYLLSLSNGSVLLKGLVEVELTAKVSRRYREKCLRYLARHDISNVLWVCTPSIKEQIQESCKNIEGSSSLFMFIDYDELLLDGIKKVTVKDIFNKDLRWEDIPDYRHVKELSVAEVKYEN